MNSAISHILVVGRDFEAWISALAMRRAFGPRGVRVTLLELPSQIVETDVVTTVPAAEALHEMLGLRQRDVARSCCGVPMAGQRFSNWSRAAPPFIHAYDAGSDSQAGASFFQYWLKARQEGLDVALEEFSVPAAGAKQGRVPASPMAGGAAIGFQFDARRYAGLWKTLALRAGVDHRTGRLARIDRHEEGIAAVHWEGGEEYRADLYIDASGAEALLAGQMPGAQFESWSHWLPSNRILSASAPPLTILPPFSQVSAFRAGWVGLHPLQDRTAVTGAFAAEYADDEQILGLPALAGAPITGDVTIAEFEPGGRSRPWIGNCVAVGRTCVELEPLDAIQLHLLHIGLTTLIRQIDAVASHKRADIYNGTMLSYASNVRDFQIAHYRLNRRFDEPLWDRAREADGPPALDAKIAQFNRDGTVAMQANESFQQSNWTSLFVGHGLVPRSYDPWVDQMAEEEHMALIQDRLSEVAEAVRTMPSVEAYLDDIRARRKVEA